MSVNMMSRLNFASIAVIALAAVLIVDVAAYGSGAPEEACAAARPWHTSESTNMSYQPLPASQNPYSFTVNKEMYKPGGSLEVTIEGTDTDKIFGFFLQARLISDNSSFGVFEETNLPEGSKLRPCDSSADAVTHTNPNEKNDLTFTWTAPNAKDSGSFRFVGSVALNHDDFYVGIESDTVMEGAAANLQLSFGVLLLGLLVAAVGKTN